jgi:hypothetical protein
MTFNQPSFSYLQIMQKDGSVLNSLHAELVMAACIKAAMSHA